MLCQNIYTPLVGFIWKVLSPACVALTVPFKGKLTVTRNSNDSTRFSKLETRNSKNFEEKSSSRVVRVSSRAVRVSRRAFRVSRRKFRVSSRVLRVSRRENKELIAPLIVLFHKTKTRQSRENTTQFTQFQRTCSV